MDVSAALYQDMIFIPRLKPQKQGTHHLPFLFSNFCPTPKNLYTEFKVSVEYSVRDVKFENRWAKAGLGTSNYGGIFHN